jgi:hypothetical protein
VSRIPLEDPEREWIRKKWQEIRKAQTLADASNSDWKRVNAELNVYLDRSNIFDIVQRTKIKGESLALKDALAIGNWHSRNAERHISDIQLFLRLRELEIL